MRARLGYIVKRDLEKDTLKDIEWKLLSALMQSGRRSDRQLAKELGVSQPTVSRTRKRLEDNGYVKEYTMVPCFPKIGYQILALTFVKVDNTLKTAEINKARKSARTFLKTIPEIVMLERGIGMGYDGVLMSYHKDYASYTTYLNKLRELDYLDFSRIDSFVINLLDNIQYRPLTFSTLAKHILQASEEEKKK